MGRKKNTKYEDIGFQKDTSDMNVHNMGYERYFLLTNVTSKLVTSNSCSA